MRLKTVPIFLTFFLMGIADAMGPISDGVRKSYELSNLVATLLPFFVLIAFALFSIPGGLMAARIGKKKLLLLGLCLNAIEDPSQMKIFLAGETREIAVPGSRTRVVYDPLQRTGIGISRLGTTEAVATGAYAFALHKLDQQDERNQI